MNNGTSSSIFTLPEAAQKEKFMAAIRSYRERICLIAFDEVHCLSEWWLYSCNGADILERKVLYEHYMDTVR